MDRENGGVSSDLHVEDPPHKSPDTPSETDTEMDREDYRKTHIETHRDTVTHMNKHQDQNIYKFNNSGVFYFREK